MVATNLPVERPGAFALWRGWMVLHRAFPYFLAALEGDGGRERCHCCASGMRQVRLRNWLRERKAPGTWVSGCVWCCSESRAGGFNGGAPDSTKVRQGTTDRKRT